MEKWIITSDGIKLYYELQGRGPLLLFLHGNSQTGRIFKRQVEYFQAFFTCLTLDTRAHGKSVFVGERLTFERLAQDVVEVLEAEHVDSARVLGFSDGANIAMVLASHRPELVSQLILNAGNLTHLGLYALMRWAAQLLNRLGRFLRLNLPILRLLLMDTGLNLEDLSRIKAPTLVINGQFDVVKSSHAREIAAHIPGAKLVIAPFASHLFFYFQPKRFNRLVKAFLRE